MSTNYEFYQGLYSKYASLNGQVKAAGNLFNPNSRNKIANDSAGLMRISTYKLNDNSTTSALIQHNITGESKVSSNKFINKSLNEAQKTEQKNNRPSKFLDSVSKMMSSTKDIASTEYGISKLDKLMLPTIETNNSTKVMSTSNHFSNSKLKLKNGAIELKQNTSNLTKLQTTGLESLMSSQHNKHKLIKPMKRLSAFNPVSRFSCLRSSNADISHFNKPKPNIEAFKENMPISQISQNTSLPQLLPFPNFYSTAPHTTAQSDLNSNYQSQHSFNAKEYENSGANINEVKANVKQNDQLPDINQSYFSKINESSLDMDDESDECSIKTVKKIESDTPNFSVLDRLEQNPVISLIRIESPSNKEESNSSLQCSELKSIRANMKNEIKISNDTTQSKKKGSNTAGDKQGKRKRLFCCLPFSL